MVSERKLEKRKRQGETPEEKAARKAAKKLRLEQKTRSASLSSSPPRASGVADAAPGAAAAPAKVTLAAFAAEHGIEVTGAEVEPMASFADAPFGDVALRNLASAGFAAPTPTQAISWPLALGRRDLISVAKTGSGKTLGFLLPAFPLLGAHAVAPAPTPRPKVVVLAPTRELATQIYDEGAKFAPAYGCRVCCCYGGAPKYQQVKALRALHSRGVVVATPGRLNDLIEARKVDLSELEILVLDEADRMLDMGFEPQIRSIVDACPSDRQTMLFTATWEPKVQKVARTLTTRGEPARVVFGDAASGKLVANKDIAQTLDICDVAAKKVKARALLESLHGAAAPAGRKTIVFVGTKRGCDELANELWNGGVACDSLHGDKEQWQRTQVIDAFKKDDLKVLVATDVAARGLDISDVTNVVCYDFPAGTHGIEDYVHRIGRTGRAGKKGEAHSFLTRGDAVSHGRALAQILRDAGQAVPPELEQLGSRGGKGGKGGRGKGGRRPKGGGGGRGGGWGKGRGGGGGSSWGGGSKWGGSKW